MDRKFLRARRSMAAVAAALLAAGGLTVGVTTAAAAAVAPQTFTCADGALDSYVVPAGVTSVRVRAEGGGAGGAITATLDVTPGQVLAVIAGCDSGGGYHWGGGGGVPSGDRCAAGRPGGGSSAVLTEDFDAVIVEAGGGGGDGGDCGGFAGGAGGAGGQTGVDGGPGDGTEAATGGLAGRTATGLGGNGRDGRAQNGAGAGGGGGGCRGGQGGQGGRAGGSGGGGGGGSSCAGPLARQVSYATGAGSGRVVISPDLLTATNGGSDVVDANGNGRQDIGDRVDYRVTVVNDGGTDISGVTVASRIRQTPLALTCDRALPASLSPGASVTCTAQHVLTAADITARSFTVESVASGRSESGTTLTANATRTTQLRPVPGLTLTNTATVADRNGNGLTDSGDTVAYAVDVLNSGGGTLSDVRVTGAGPLACTPATPATLVTGESVHCTATHVITTAEVDAPGGALHAVASATGRTATGQQVAAPQVDAVTPLDRIAALAVTTATGTLDDTNGSARPDSGDAIRYAVTVTNTGTLTVSGVAAALAATAPAGAAELDCAPATLAPGAVLTCAADYPVGQADADRGSVVHTATATGTADGKTVAAQAVPVTTLVPVVADLAASAAVVSVADRNDNALTDAGDTVTYRVDVTNNGTVTMTGVAIAGVAMGCAETTLLPGASTACTGTYDITQQDVDGGERVTHTVTANGTTPAGAAVSSAPSELSTTLSRVPALAATGRVESIVDRNGNGLLDAGDVLTYAVVVTNTGTVTLSGVAPAFAPLALDCGPSALAPAASVTCHATYTVTQSDVDTGTVEHTASAAGTTPWGAPVAAEPSTARTDLDQRGTVAVVNEAVLADGDGRADAGDVVTYTVRATNTGTVTLTGVTALEAAGAVELDCAPATLAPGEVLTCTGTYPLTQDDVDNGSVTHTASALGVTPAGGVVIAEPAQATTELARASSLGLTNEVSADGDTLTYAVTVTNTGNTTLADVTAGGDVDLDCEPTTLAPGTVLTCTGTYTVMQADIDSGAVTHTVTASGTAPDGTAVDAVPATAVTSLTREAGLVTALTATVVDRDGDGRTGAGDEITYTVTAANSGGVTLSEVAPTLALRDRTAPALGCAPAVLAPAAQLTCTATYVVTSADESAGEVVATASATGVTPAGERLTSAVATATTAVAAAAAPTTPASHGDGLAWTGVTAVTEMVVVGVLVLAVGLGLLLFTRRRRRG